MSIEPNGASAGAAPGAAPTVSHILGEMAWLMTQSLLHKALPIEALEWLAMPALIHRQFYIFREPPSALGPAPRRLPRPRS